MGPGRAETPHNFDGAPCENEELLKTRTGSDHGLLICISNQTVDEHDVPRRGVAVEKYPYVGLDDVGASKEVTLCVTWQM